jgi:hypothetical protein
LEKAATLTSEQLVPGEEFNRLPPLYTTRDFLAFLVNRSNREFNRSSCDKASHTVMSAPSSEGFETNLGGMIEPLSQVNTNTYDQQQEQQKEEEIVLTYDLQQEHQIGEDIILCLASNEKSRIRIALAPIVPINSPAPWIAINSVCCLGSVFLIRQVLRTAGPVERRYGTQEYITWNLVTTFFWVTEIGLTVWYNPVMSSWVHRIELVIAFYFMIDSIDMLYHWQIPDDDIKAELLDVTICALAYFFELIVTIRAYRRLLRSEQEQDKCVIDDDPSKIGATTDYATFTQGDELV